MVAALLVMVAYPARADFTSPQLSQALEAQRCRLRLASPNTGTLSAGVRLDVVLTTSAQPQSSVAVIALQGRFLPKHRITSAALAKWVFDRGSVAPSVTYFVQVDGSVSVRWRGPIQSEDSVNTVARLVAAEMTEIAAFAKDFDVQPVPRSRQVSDKDIDYHRTMDAPDRLDVQILTEVWGWRYKKGWAGSGPDWVWNWPATVDAVDVWMQSGVPSGPNWILKLTSKLPCTPKDPDSWVKAQNALLRFGSVRHWSDQGTLELSADVDYRSGVTPSKLKDTLELFAQEAKHLAQAGAR